MAPPRYLLSRKHKNWVRTAGDLTLNGTAWTAVPTVASLVIPAQVDDTLMVKLAGTIHSEAVDAFLDVHTGANYFASAGGAAGEGIPGAVGVSGAVSRINVDYLYKVVAGDLASGEVTLVLRYRTSTATAKTLRATADRPLQFAAWNIGPVDPN